MTSKRAVDVLIIGGGPAGLSAALTLSRTKRTVAVFDSGVYRNAKAPYMHTVPRFDHTSPLEYRKGMLDELVARYSDTFQYVSKKAITLRKLDATESGRSSFQLELDDREVWTGRKVVLATGLQDKLPDVPGFDAIWGKSVVHSILLDPATGAPGGHVLMMFFQKFTNLKNESVTIIANGVFGEGATEPRPAPEYGISEDIIALANHRGVKWELRPIQSISAADSSEHPPAVFHFKDGSNWTVPWVVHSPLTQTPESMLALLSDPSMSALKATVNSPNPMFKIPMGEIPTSGMFYKSEKMDGVYIAGNAGLFMATVVLSISQGQMAAVGADNEIGMEDYEDELKKAKAAAGN
ncbi:FAD/NAD(P)-binding domain-containing protein [Serendipita vermifera]|nr:FAD/NAD(P)-binding domain-containing protein [Serendipita vermifera]